MLTSCDISDLWVGGARNRPGLQLAGQLWIQIVVYSLSLSLSQAPIAVIFVISPFSSGKKFCRMACTRMEIEQAFFQKVDSAKGLLNLAYEHTINMYLL